jgi:aryl-alcohol dehydrogenase-like predicted oxidoreductase
VEYRTLGRTGLNVSRLIFGGLHIGERLSKGQSDAVFAAAFDHGINAFYTADVYADGAAEVALGRAIKGRRDDAVIFIKAGYRVGTAEAPVARAELDATHGGGALDHDTFRRQGVSPTSRGLSRKHLTQALDASLRRLGTDYIDVYMAHFWDPSTPIEETLGTLDGFVRQGKVRYLGASQHRPWQLYRALWASDKLSLSRYEGVQLRVNLLERAAQVEYLPAAREAGVGVLAHQSLAGGLLSGEYGRGSSRPTGLGSLQTYTDRYWTDGTFDFLERLGDLAASLGRTVGGLSQAWVLAQEGVAALLVGPNNPAELRPQVDAASSPLSIEEIAAVDALLKASNLPQYPTAPDGA